MAPDSPARVPRGADWRQDVGGDRFAEGDAGAGVMWNTYIWVESADETAAKVTTPAAAC